MNFMLRADLMWSFQMNRGYTKSKTKFLDISNQYKVSSTVYIYIYFISKKATNLDKKTDKQFTKTKFTSLVKLIMFGFCRDSQSLTDLIN